MLYLSILFVFRQIGCIRAKWLNLGKSSCVRTNSLYLGKIGCIQANWL